MSDRFREDLYKKKGSNFVIWDLVIGAGIASILAGLGLMAKEKMSKKFGKPESKPVSIPVKEERQPERQPVKIKGPKNNDLNDESDIFGKLGL